MRPIRLVKLDETRPVLVLTHESARPYLGWVSVAPITNAIKGIRSEVPVGPANGLDHECVVNCDNIATILNDELGRLVGYLLPEQELDLADAIRAAFDLN